MNERLGSTTRRAMQDRNFDPFGNQRMLRLPNVIGRVGMSRSHVLALVKSGEFPAPVKLGARAVAWVESEVNAWIEARISARPRPQLAPPRA